MPAWFAAPCPAPGGWTNFGSRILAIWSRAPSSRHHLEILPLPYNLMKTLSLSKAALGGRQRYLTRDDRQGSGEWETGEPV